MSLRLIYGRAGTGKTEFCFQDIKDKENKETKIYIITPEQFSFTAEQKLLEILEKDSVINAEVISFNRMANRIFTEVYGACNTNLSPVGKSMLLYSILQNEKNKLNFLGNSDETIDILDRTIKDFKKHNVTTDILENAISNIDNKYVNAKLTDLSLIYKAYENQIKNNYIDEDDTLTILANLIDKSSMFNNSIVYIDEFAGFTPQEYEIIRKLLKLTEQVNITLCIDKIEDATNPDIDIFYSNKVTANRLIDCAKKENIEIEEPIVLNENYRFLNDELNHLEQNIYSVKYKRFNDDCKNINLYLAQNLYDEIEYVSQNIIDLVRNNGYRYNDISVISKNIDTYSSLVKAIFNKYEIPVFIDEPKDLSQNVLIKYILAIFDIFTNNWSNESVFNYIKTGLCDIENEDIYYLENYCTKWGIKGRKWYESNFENVENDEELQRLNSLREKVTKPLLDFKNSLENKDEVQQICNKIYELLVQNNIQEKIQNKVNKLEKIGQIEIGRQYENSVKLVLEVLDEMVMIFKNKKVTISQFKNILKLGFSNSSLKDIPTMLDQVVVGSVDRSRSHKVKAIFIIGLNDGVFPSVNKDEGFLNDDDRILLEENGVELAKGTIQKLYEDQFNIYKAFTTAQEKLYLSYSSSDKESKALRPSILISKIKKIYPKLKERSGLLENQNNIGVKQSTFLELLKNLQLYVQGKKIDDIWWSVCNWYLENEEYSLKLKNALCALKYDNTSVDSINEENINRLYGKILKTSVSRLEQYKKCPFSFYLKYGLKLEEKKEYKLEAVDTGSFMHDVIDEFFQTIGAKQLSIKELSKEEIRKIANNIIDEKLKLKKNYIFTSSAKFIHLTSRLKKVVLQSLEYIVYQLSISDFEVFGNEIEFSKDKQYPPITMELEDGKKIEITGKIDRIDIAKTKDDKKIIRIIDYKSSIKNVDLNQVYAGLQIQLLTYLDAITCIEDVLPAGVLYFNLLDPIIKNNKNLTDEQIEEEIKKQFKMKGLILADVNIIRMMDKELEKGYSSVVPAYIDKDGNISNTRSSIATKEEFDNLQKYINKLIKKISKEILSGNIDIKPCYDAKNKTTACDYCSYKSICKFDLNKNEYEYIGNFSKDTIMEKIK